MSVNPPNPSLSRQHLALVEPWSGRARPTARQASYSSFPSAGSRVASGSSTYLVCHPVYQLITHGPIVHFPAIHLRSYLVRIPILQSWFKYPLPCPFVSPPSPPRRPPSSTPFLRSILSSGAPKSCSLVVVPCTRALTFETKTFWRHCYHLLLPTTSGQAV